MKLALYLQYCLAVLHILLQCVSPRGTRNERFGIDCTYAINVNVRYRSRCWCHRKSIYIYISMSGAIPGHSSTLSLSLTLSTASATGRHLKHTMHMSVKGGNLEFYGQIEEAATAAVETCLLAHGRALSRNRFAQSQHTFLCLYSQRCNRNAGTITMPSSHPLPSIHTHTNRYRVALYAKNDVFAHKFDICTNVFSAGAGKKCTNIVHTTGTATYNSYATWAWQRDHLRVFIKTHSIYMAFTSAQSTASTRIKSEIVY